MSNFFKLFKKKNRTVIPDIIAPINLRDITNISNLTNDRETTIIEQDFNGQKLNVQYTKPSLTDVISSLQTQINNLNYLIDNLIKEKRNNQNHINNLKWQLFSLDSEKEKSKKDYEEYITKLVDENSRIQNNLTSITEKKNINELFTCSICMTRIKDYIFLPCAHFTCCSVCVVPLKDCPICRTKINEAVKIYY